MQHPARLEAQIALAHVAAWPRLEPAPIYRHHHETETVRATTLGGTTSFPPGTETETEGRARRRATCVIGDGKAVLTVDTLGGDVCVRKGEAGSRHERARQSTLAAIPSKCYTVKRISLAVEITADGCATSLEGRGRSRCLFHSRWSSVAPSLSATGAVTTKDLRSRPMCWCQPHRLVTAGQVTVRGESAGAQTPMVVSPALS